MENYRKKCVNRFLSFCMVLVMVVTAVAAAPMTVKAEDAGTTGTTVLTVHFKNEKNWDKVYTKFGSGDSWNQIKGYEYCKNDTDYEYAFSSKDLNMLEYLPDMMNLGIESYKIEGRMKSMYYIATVANAYRTIMDKKIDGTLTEDDITYYKKVLNRVSNRENTDQFYNGVPHEEGQYFNGRQELSNQDFLALVLEYDEETKIATVEQRNKFSVGDTLEVFGPTTKVNSFEIESILNDKEEYVFSASHAQEIVKIKIPFKVNKDDIIRVKIS